MLASRGQKGRLEQGAEPPMDLVSAARRAARRAHAPYSGFSVGAALRDDQGRIYTGANLENASYPLSICAERVALLDWRADGGRSIAEIVIFTPTEEPTPPCGLCREALLRWAPQARVHLAWKNGLSDPHLPEEWLPRCRPGDKQA